MGIISIAKDYLNFDKTKSDLEHILKDKSNDTEMIEMAKKDLSEIEEKKQLYENKIKIFLLQKMKMMTNAIVEIRAGTGGLEASLFCADLFKMYESLLKKEMANRND